DPREREILQLEIEQSPRQKEKDEGSRTRLKKLEKQLADLKEQSARLKTQWQNEKAAINAASLINSQIEQAKAELEKAQRTGDLNLAAQIQYGKLPDLQKNLAAAEKASYDQQAGKRMPSKEGSWTDIHIAE